MGPAVVSCPLLDVLTVLAFSQLHPWSQQVNPFPQTTQISRTETANNWEGSKEGGFPGGAVVENLPANAGDTGSSPGLGRSHMPRSN